MNGSSAGNGLEGPNLSVLSVRCYTLTKERVFRLSEHLLLPRYRGGSWLQLYRSSDRQQWANIHNFDEGLHDIFSQPKSDVSKMRHEYPKPQVVWTYSFHDWKNPGLPLIVLVSANNKIHLVRMVVRLVLSSKSIM